jgi:hypothetical protein
VFFISWATIFPRRTVFHGNTSRALVNKLITAQLVQKFPDSYGIRSFFAVFTRICHWSLSWARLIQFTLSHPIYLRFILILWFHLCVGLPSNSFSSPVCVLHVQPICSLILSLELCLVKHRPANCEAAPCVTSPSPLLQTVLALGRFVLRNFTHTNLFNEARTLCFARHPNANSLIGNLPNKVLPSVPIKCASIHLSALETLQPTEKKMKARKMFIFPFWLTGRIYVNIFVFL